MEHLIYSLPYAALVVFYMLIAYSYRYISDKNIVILFCAFIYIIFFGMRGLVGDDWTVYCPLYRDYPAAFSVVKPVADWFHGGYEPGFMLLLATVRFFSPDYQMFVFVQAAINCILLFNFLRRYADNPVQSLVIFICMGGFTLQTDLMRNSLSLLVFVNSIQFIEERKPLKYFASVTVSLLFHSSSIFFFPLYFLLYRKCPKYVFGLILLVGNIVFISNLHLVTPLLHFMVEHLGGKYQTLAEIYVGNEFAGNYGLTVGYLERLLTSVLIFVYYKKLIQRKDSNILFINSFLIYFILVFLFSEIAVLSRRSGMLFIFSYWVLWGELLHVMKLRNNRFLFHLFIQVYCIIKIIGLSSHPIWDYDNALTGTGSYEERTHTRNLYQPK
jgi:hypothetical protein